MIEKWEKLSLGWILVRKWLVITGQRELILKLSQNGRLPDSFFLELYLSNQSEWYFSGQLHHDTHALLNLPQD